VAADDSGALPFADARAAAEAAGLRVIDLRMESLHTEFRDIGAVIYFLRKVIWIVPGFTVARARYTASHATHPPMVTPSNHWIGRCNKPALLA